MSCAELCPELESQDKQVSPGPITAPEIICRGAYTPNHGKNLNIKQSFLRKADLLAGTLSVWRVSDRADMTIAQLQPRLAANGPDKSTLMAVMGVSASDIRALKTDEIEARAFCIKDECSIDDMDTKHKAHAHIALCQCTFPDGSDVDSPVFQQVFRDLAGLFKERVLWP